MTYEENNHQNKEDNLKNKTVNFLKTSEPKNSFLELILNLIMWRFGDKKTYSSRKIDGTSNEIELNRKTIIPIILFIGFCMFLGSINGHFDYYINHSSFGAILMLILFIPALLFVLINEKYRTNWKIIFILFIAVSIYIYSFIHYLK